MWSKKINVFNLVLFLWQFSFQGQNFAGVNLMFILDVYTPAFQCPS